MNKVLLLLSFLLLFVGCGAATKPYVQTDLQLAKLQAEEMNALKADVKSLNIELKNQMEANISLRSEITASLRAELKNNMQGNIGQGNTNTAQEFDASGENSKIVSNDTVIFKWWAIFATIMLLATMGILGKIIASRSKHFTALIKSKKNGGKKHEK